jgi:hypothetical protein
MKSIKHARIMTFGYDANISRLSSTASSSELYGYGKSLEFELGHIRSDDLSRPIILSPIASVA